jgi:hypothetical protein
MKSCPWSPGCGVGQRSPEYPTTRGNGHPTTRASETQERGEAGRITLSHLFAISVLMGALMAGMRLSQPWLTYLQLKAALQEAATQAPALTDTELITTVLTRAQELHLDLTPHHIEVARSATHGARLRASYGVTVTLLLGASHTLYFQPEVWLAR